MQNKSLIIHSEGNLDGDSELYRSMQLPDLRQLQGMIAEIVAWDFYFAGDLFLLILRRIQLPLKSLVPQSSAFSPLQYLSL